MEGDRAYADVSRQGYLRMPYYVKCLSEMQAQGARSVSAPTIAAMLKMNEVQVRKDLAAVSRAKGKPKSGFPVNELLEDLKRFLGFDHVDDAILVGAGSIGRALMGYRGFEDYGLRIVAAFDANPSLWGETVNGIPVYPPDELGRAAKETGARIGIIAVPAEAAQGVCDRLVEAGILGIWNFAPAHLNAPDEILIQYENMAASLAILNNHLRSRMKGGEGA